MQLRDLATQRFHRSKSYATIDILRMRTLDSSQDIHDYEREIPLE